MNREFKSVTVPCECEHECHFHEGVSMGKRKFSPNGNPGHRYQIKYFPRTMRAIKTPNGTFLVCSDCVTDCFQMEL